MTGTKRADKVTRKERGTEPYKTKTIKETEAHTRADCNKGQETEEFIGLELVWREASNLLFSICCKTIMFLLSNNYYSKPLSPVFLFLWICFTEHKK